MSWRHATTIGLIVIAVSAGVAVLRDPEPPARAARQFSVDLGALRPSQVIEHTFELSNTERSELIVESARSGCTCTRIELSSERVPPGGDLRVTLRLDLEGRSGPQVQTGFVEFAGDAPPLRFVVRCYLLGKPYCVPGAATTPPPGEGEARSIEFSLVIPSSSPEAVEVQPLEVPVGFSVDLGQPTVTAFESRYPVKIDLRVDVAAPSVNLVTFSTVDAGETATASFSVVVENDATIQVSPRRLIFADRAGHARVSVDTADGEEPLVACEPTGSATIEPNGPFRFVVTLGPDSPGRFAIVVTAGSESVRIPVCVLEARSHRGSAQFIWADTEEPIPFLALKRPDSGATLVTDIQGRIEVEAVDGVGETLEVMNSQGEMLCAAPGDIIRRDPTGCHVIGDMIGCSDEDCSVYSVVVVLENHGIRATVGHPAIDGGFAIRLPSNVYSIGCHDGEKGVVKGPFELHDGASFSVTLDVAHDFGGLSGVVMDVSGSPIYGANVIVAEPVEFRTLLPHPDGLQAVTNEVGFFEVAPCAAGPKQIQVSTPESDAIHFFDALAPDRELELVLDNGDCSVRGRVVTAEGDPGRGAIAFVQSLNGERRLTRTVHQDEAQFQFSGLKCGNPVLVGASMTGDSFLSATREVVPEESEEEIVLVLPEHRTIEGQVSGADSLPNSGRLLVEVDLGSGRARERTPGEDGKFSIPWCPVTDLPLRLVWRAEGSDYVIQKTIVAASNSLVEFALDASSLPSASLLARIGGAVPIGEQILVHAQQDSWRATQFVGPDLSVGFHTAPAGRIVLRVGTEAGKVLAERVVVVTAMQTLDLGTIEVPAAVDTEFMLISEGARMTNPRGVMGFVTDLEGANQGQARFSEGIARWREHRRGTFLLHVRADGFGDRCITFDVTDGPGGQVLVPLLPGVDVEMVVESDSPGRRLSVYREGELIDSRWRLTDSTTWEFRSSLTQGAYSLELSGADGRVLGRANLNVDGPGTYAIRMVP